MDHLGSPRELPEAQPKIEGRSSNDYEVRLLQCFRAGPRERETMVCGYAAATLTVRETGGLRSFNKLDQVILGTVEPDVRSGHDDRPLGRCDQADDLIDPGRVGLWLRSGGNVGEVEVCDVEQNI